MRQEDVLGPQVVLETVLAQRHLFVPLLPDAATDVIRSRMLSLLADVTRFTGWVLFNLNDFTGAGYYYSEARSAAHEADDDAMCSMVLSNWSQLGRPSGDPRPAWSMRWSGRLGTTGRRANSWCRMAVTLVPARTLRWSAAPQAVAGTRTTVAVWSR